MASGFGFNCPPIVLGLPASFFDQPGQDGTFGFNIDDQTLMQCVAGTWEAVGGGGGGPPSGAAGGDLAGTYPNPTLASSISTAVSLADLTAGGKFTLKDTQVTVTGAAYVFPVTTPSISVTAVTGSPGALTVTGTGGLIIAAGTYESQVITLINLTSTTLTLTNNNGISSNSGADIVIAQGRCASFIWKGLGPLWLQSDATSDAAAIVSGTLPVVRGGTGATSLTTNGFIYGAGTGALLATSAATDGQFPVGATGSAPVPRTMSGDAALSSTGVLTLNANKFMSKAADYAMASTDNNILMDATGGAKTVTLPLAASCTSQAYTIKKIDASVNAVTVDGNGAETIDGAATKSLPLQYNSVTVASDGTTWWIL